MVSFWQKLAVRGLIVSVGAAIVACSVTSTTTTTNDDGGTSSSGGSSGSAHDAGKDGSSGGSSSGGSSSGGSSSGGSSSGEGGACTLNNEAKTGDATCDQCSQASCCAELNACFTTGSDCVALESCVATCIGDGGTDAGDCIQQCAQAHQASVALHNAWAKCIKTNCATQCGL